MHRAHPGAMKALVPLDHAPRVSGLTVEIVAARCGGLFHASACLPARARLAHQVQAAKQAEAHGHGMKLGDHQECQPDACTGYFKSTYCDCRHLHFLYFGLEVKPETTHVSMGQTQYFETYLSGSKGAEA